MNNLTEKAKRDAGRYTLEEAAKFVAENSNASADSILEKLKKAAVYDRLTVYEPGSNEVYKDMPSIHVARDKRMPGVRYKLAYGHVEAYWNDLNDWLKKNEPRLDCKEFPNPNTLTAAAKDGTVPTAKKAGTNKKKWDDAKLEALWKESILPGVTQASLANKHGVKPQRISTLLAKAKDVHNGRKVSPYSLAGQIYQANKSNKR